MDYPKAPELSENVLARRAEVPLKPTSVTLEGSFVRLAPLDLDRDVDGLWAVSNALCLCAFDPVTGRAVGAANLMSNVPEHLTIELGNIWCSPLVQRTKVNLEATYLLLRRAFELGYRRVEWKCDALNERSRRAALRMGFTFEGIQEQHFMIEDRNRDTAWFRVLDREWSSVRERLEEKL